MTETKTKPIEETINETTNTLTAHEERMYAEYQTTKHENYILKNRLHNLEKDHKKLKKEYDNLNKKYKREQNNRKPRYRNNGKAGK